jgi:acetyltransferase-like isoleucine patch superfamily enzyme
MVIKRIKNIFIKIIKNKKRDKFFGLTQKGNLKIGKDCNIEGLNIQINSTLDNYLNLEIGDDCYLSGTIVLHDSKAKIRIGDRVFIGPGTTLFCYEGIEIFNDVMISWGCTLIDTNAHSLSSEERINDVLDWKRGWQYKNWSVVKSKKIIIEDKCWVGFNSIIVKGVVLSEGTVVASGSVVTKSTDAFTVIGGNPAQKIKMTT